MLQPRPRGASFRSDPLIISRVAQYPDIGATASRQVLCQASRRASGASRLHNSAQMYVSEYVQHGTLRAHSPQNADQAIWRHFTSGGRDPTERPARNVAASSTSVSAAMAALRDSRKSGRANRTHPSTPNNSEPAIMGMEIAVIPRGRARLRHRHTSTRTALTRCIASMIAVAETAAPRGMNTGPIAITATAQRPLMMPIHFRERIVSRDAAGAAAICTNAVAIAIAAAGSAPANALPKSSPTVHGSTAIAIPVSASASIDASSVDAISTRSGPPYPAPASSVNKA